ncbi:hypothetical protein JCM10213_009170 [Rhodosporidiobolus nylandii]
MAYLTPPSDSTSYPSASVEAAAFVSSSSSLPRRPSDVCLPTAKRPRSALANRQQHPSSTAITSTYPAPAHQSLHDWLSDPSLSFSPSTLPSHSHPHSLDLDAQLAALEHSAAWSSVPGAPAQQSHCPTPILTPQDVVEVQTAPSFARPPLPPTRSSASGVSSSFIRRDDLTARAVAKAQEQQAQVQQVQQGASEKDRFVSGLVGASVLAIESIWGSSSAASAAAASPAQQPSVLPMQWFVKEVLRRSRTSCSTLQLALYYLHKSRRDIREAVAAAEGARGQIVRLEAEIKAVKASAAAGLSPSSGRAYPSPPHSPLGGAGETDTTATVAAVASLGAQFTALAEAQNSPVLCGRRMFLAALISASKYLQDRNYSNRAWAKISGLSVQEINANERAFLRLVGFQLHLKAEDFQRWTERLSTLTSSASPVAPSASGGAQLPTPHTSPTLLARHGLARSSSEYVPAGPSATASVGGARPIVPRATLNRGATVPILSREKKGFPIAQPRPTSQVQQTVSPASTVSPTSSDEGDLPPHLYGRKLRALPVRRATPPVAMQVDSRSFVPASWATGAGASAGVMEGMGIRQGEAVRAH